ncbi:hypothetical protein BCR43DRAFT_492271 [Syncephalastrum racemosum]|uniref:Uncharacterized protein n=1 Tax=Syncephalastrum racemosum TaxID=13706 RepID=A0A1X2HDC5_SYNRA|nr:hypothetical protein BCR43DRAFT_492271 [Syncephalastrum racemosum]
MKFYGSLAVGLAMAATTWAYFQGFEPYGRPLRSLCHAGNAHVLTGFGPLDRFLCFYIYIFDCGFRDPIGSNVLVGLLAMFGVSLTVMAVEGSRRGANRLLTYLPFWGLLANFLGISIVLPLLWIPTFYYQENTRPHVNPSRANAILLSILIGYVLPTVAMAADVLPREQQHILIAVWQFAPLWITPLCKFASSMLACTDTVDEPSFTEEARRKIRQADSKSAVERLYLFLGVINILVHYYLYVRMQVQGLGFMDTLLTLWDKLDASSQTFPPLDALCELFSTEVFFVDFVGTWLALISWVFFEDGIIATLFVIVGSVIVSPAGAIAFYAAYRENRVQAIKSKQE